MVRTIAIRLMLGMLVAIPVRAGEVGPALVGSDPDSWGSYRGLRVPSNGDSRVARSYLPTAPKSSLSVDSASANNEGGVVTFHYAPNFKDSSKDQGLRSAVQPPVGSRSGLSFYGQLGDPRYGLKGGENLMPSDRVGGFVFDAQRDFRRYPGFSLGIGYDF
jgi:hypothetical protein